MKNGIRLAVVLCVLGAVAWGGYWLYHRYAPPGQSGRNMEVRLVAVSAAAQPPGMVQAQQPASVGPAAQPAAAAPGVDAFQPDDIRSYIANGNAPNGWRWLPVAHGVEREIVGDPANGASNQNGGQYVTRTSNGQLYLLTADQPDLMLTHRSGIRPWGVTSVKVESDDQGAAVEIHLDAAGGDLMHDFTEKYVNHTIAVVVGGEICEVAMIQIPVRSSLEVRLPQGEQAEAESLRDALMK